MPSRHTPEALLPWALASLGSATGAEMPQLTSVAGDASARRYFRLVSNGRSYIAVDAPPVTENNAAFVAVRALLADAGLRVPALLAADLQHGYLLLEDLGDRLLLSALDGASAEAHYQRAFGLLLKMHRFDPGQAHLGDYHKALLEEELGRFQQWFVEALLGVLPTAQETALIARVGDQLVTSALQQPQVLVHRDFHSRNLMLVEQDSLAVIDFQDALLGPCTYDLVSLLRDCYIRWPPNRVERWAINYLTLLQAQGLPTDIDRVTFLRWFDWMGLQRHLKVLGTFARLSLRDNKPAYLADLPLVIDYVLEILDKYAAQEPAFAALHGWFITQLAPVIARQDWSH